MSKPCPDLSILTRDFLYQAYCIENMSILAIARKVHCRNSVIIDALNQYGLNKRPTKEQMIDLYVTQEKSVDEIATLLRCTEANVRYYLRNFHIAIRYKSRGRIQLPSLNNRDWLYEKYVIQHLPSTAIADELNCCVSSVQQALKRFEITRRKAGSQNPKSGHTYRRSFSHRKRRLILQRDHHQCRVCGSKESLEIHHIIPAYQQGTNSFDNGITLCELCHNATFGKELEYAQLFQSLINKEPFT